MSLCTITTAAMLMMPTQAEIQTMEPVEVEQWIAALEAPLNQAERDRIWNELHLAVIRMQSCLTDAEMHAQRIPDLDVRKATRAAIEGAICGIACGNGYSMVIAACLSTISRIAGDAYYEWMDARECVKEAKVYARIADNLQERLWRDE